MADDGDDGGAFRVREGAPLLLRSGEWYEFNQAAPDASTQVAKLPGRGRRARVSLAPLVGSTHGALFQVRGLPDAPALALVTPQAPDAAAARGRASAAPAAAADDNRDLSDRGGAAQRLSCDAVVALKQSGASADEIVGSLAAHSDTFALKTTFAQEKYIRRKTEKCARVLSLSLLMKHNAALTTTHAFA